MEFQFHSELLNQNEIVLNEEDRKHLLKSLRKKVGDVIGLIDGKGTQAEGAIKEITKKSCVVKLHSLVQHPRITPNIDLFVGILKNQKRIEWMVEKAVELGVRKIVFLSSERSLKPRINIDRLERICIAALKQSQQFWLPEIHISSIGTLEEHIAQDATILLAQCFGTRTSINEVLKERKEETIQLFIGPEGDFTEAESASIQKLSGLPIILTHSRLRTETAAIAGLSYLRFKTQLPH